MISTHYNQIYFVCVLVSIINDDDDVEKKIFFFNFHFHNFFGMHVFDIVIKFFSNFFFIYFRLYNTYIYHFNDLWIMDFSSFSFNWIHLMFCVVFCFVLFFWLFLLWVFHLECNLIVFFMMFFLCSVYIFKCFSNRMMIGQKKAKKNFPKEKKTSFFVHDNGIFFFPLFTLWFIISFPNFDW